MLEIVTVECIHNSRKCDLTKPFERIVPHNAWCWRPLQLIASTTQGEHGCRVLSRIFCWYLQRLQQMASTALLKEVVRYIVSWDIRPTGCVFIGNGYGRMHPWTLPRRQDVKRFEKLMLKDVLIWPHAYIKVHPEFCGYRKILFKGLPLSDPQIVAVPLMQFFLL